MNRFWVYYCAVLLAILLTAILLYIARLVFMPLAVAGMLALVFMRLCDWLERRGVPRLLTALISGVLFAGLVAGVVLLVNWYIHRFAADDSLQQNIGEVIAQARGFLRDQWGVNVRGTKGMWSLIGSADAGKMTTTVVGSIVAVVMHLILTVVYMVMLLSMRGHVKEFFLRLVKPENEQKVRTILTRSVKVAQDYIFGMMIVILYLCTLYSVAFSVIGVRYAVFFAILCGLLEIIPFVGSITGTTLTCIMALSQGGGMHMVVWVLVSYATIQASQFYIVAPLVMREQVNLSPLFTIVVLIAGDLLWGIPGMIVAIPCLAILKIVCDEVEFLQSFGFLLGRTRPTHGRWKRPWAK
ncbi:MAG TPA: AI-2E family transporter [Puia sp.]|uniref:AI-2E family transporter n=1 Tax=Puia sp. TaxID=2045100 RepID=UPI002D1A56A0|nr:AI-2E family transporter [Puia sp.]HVU98071.1 AI-2E family transporter [Puia sp.]